jgi:hypothetical protein
MPNTAQRADAIPLRLYSSQIMYTSLAPSRSNENQVNRTECIPSYRFFLSLVSLPTGVVMSTYEEENEEVVG